MFYVIIFECYFIGLYLFKIYFIIKGIYFYFKNIENLFYYIEISIFVVLIMVL